MNNIFVGNLSFKATKEDVVKLFEPFGMVANVIIMEGKKGTSRGYGFVNMPNEEEKNAAIAALAGKEFMWRVLSVSPVAPKVKSEVKLDQEPKKRSKSSKSTSEGPSKHLHKFDGPSKPWRKVKSAPKPSRKKDKGARPYYGKKDKGSTLGDKKKGGFKMAHKVLSAKTGRLPVPQDQ